MGRKRCYRLALVLLALFLNLALQPLAVLGQVLPQAGDDRSGEPISERDAAQLESIQGRARAAATPMVVAATAGAAQRITLDSLDGSSFPEVQAFATVQDADGNFVSGLTSADFVLTERHLGNGQSARLQAVVSELSGTATKADVAFVVDESGSMSDEIATVRQGIRDFARLLQDNSIDFRVGGVSYEGAGSGIGVGVASGGLTSDLGVFDAWVSQIGVQGGEERAYDALVHLCNTFHFRPDAQQIVVLVTDEPNDTGQFGPADAAQGLTGKSLFYFNTGVDSAVDRDFSPLGIRLGGAFDKQALLARLGDSIVNRYVIRYGSPFPDVDGQPREVGLQTGLVYSNSLEYVPRNKTTIEGTVSDKETGQPIRKAPVTVLDSSGFGVVQTTTDDSGFYTVEVSGQDRGARRSVRADQPIEFSEDGKAYESTTRSGISLSGGTVRVDLPLEPVPLKDVKRDLINWLSRHRQYADEEAAVKAFVEALDETEPHRVVALRRIILAEQLVAAAHEDAEVMSQDASEGVVGLLGTYLGTLKVVQNIDAWMGNLVQKSLKLPSWLGGNTVTKKLQALHKKTSQEVQDAANSFLQTSLHFAFKLIPDNRAKDALQLVISQAVTFLVSGNLNVASAVESVVNQLVADRFLDWGYDNLTDEFLQESLQAAEASRATSGTEALAGTVGARCTEMHAGTDRVHRIAEGSYDAAAVGQTVSDVAEAAALVSAASGIGAILAATSKVVGILGKIAYFGGTATGIGLSSNRLFSELPGEVRSGTAEAFGGRSWARGTPEPSTLSATPRHRLDARFTADLSPLGLEVAALLAQLADHLAADRVEEALDLAASDAEDGLSAVQTRLLGRLQTAETLVASAGAESFSKSGLYRLSFLDLARSSPELRVRQVDFETRLLNFLSALVEGHYRELQDPAYLEAREEVIMAVVRYRQAVLAQVTALETAEDRLQAAGIGLPVTVLVDQVQTRSNGGVTNVLATSPQKFTVEARVRNTNPSRQAVDVTAVLELGEGLTLEQGNAAIGLGCLQPEDQMPGAGPDEAVATWQVVFHGPLREGADFRIRLQEGDVVGTRTWESPSAYLGLLVTPKLASGTNQGSHLSAVDSGGGCFIATAAYGSALQPEVEVLRDFRDRHLLTNGPGRAFVSLYYRWSPGPADWIRDRPWVRAAVRVPLNLLVTSIRHPGGAVGILAALLVLAVWRRRRTRSVVGV